MEMATTISCFVIWRGDSDKLPSDNRLNYSGAKRSFELDGGMDACVERKAENLEGGGMAVHRNVMIVQRADLECDFATCRTTVGQRLARARCPCGGRGAKFGAETRFVVGVRCEHRVGSLPRMASLA